MQLPLITSWNTIRYAERARSFGLPFDKASFEGPGGEMLYNDTFRRAEEATSLSLPFGGTADTRCPPVQELIDAAVKRRDCNVRSRLGRKIASTMEELNISMFEEARLPEEGTPPHSCSRERWQQFGSRTRSTA